MDTHIATYPTANEARAASDSDGFLRSRPPGEADTPPLHDNGDASHAPGPEAGATSGSREALRIRLPGEADTPPLDADGAASNAPSPEAAASPAAPAADERLARSDAMEPKRRRGGLLFGVSLVALAGVAGAAFMISPYNHVYPVPGMASTMRRMVALNAVRLPTILAPSASLAKVAVAPSPPAVRPRYVAQSKPDEVQELLALQDPVAVGGKPPEPVMKDPPPAGEKSTTGIAATPSAGSNDHGARPVPGATGRHDAMRVASLQQDGHQRPAPVAHAAPPPPPGYVAVEPGSVPAAVPLLGTAHPVAATKAVSPPAPHPTAPAGQGLTAAVLASLSPAKNHPVPVAPAKAEATPLPSPTRPADPVAVAQALHAAPMSTADQVQVLNLVNEVAHLVRDLRVQNAALRANVQRADAANAARLDDFGRRLSLAEASRAVQAARDVPDGTAAAAVATGTTRREETRRYALLPQASSAVAAARAPVRLTRVDTVVPSAAPAGAAKRYRVQAASPGLALLAEVDRGGGDGAQLQVAVGDTLPGYGKIKAIAQHGTAWVVSTEHGDIR